MTFSKKELNDLFKAWIIISFAFAIVFKDTGRFIDTVLISLVTVGTGFLLHELAHKFVAQKYGYWAEFRSNDKMLLAALVMSFFGFVFAAPGGVLMPANMRKEQIGKVALAGPMMNVVLSIVFFVLNVIYPLSAFTYGMYINSFLALFNLIPFPGFDGSKVKWWNQKVWFASIVIAGLSLYIPLT